MTGGLRISFSVMALTRRQASFWVAGLSPLWKPRFLSNFPLKITFFVFKKFFSGLFKQTPFFFCNYKWKIVFLHPALSGTLPKGELDSLTDVVYIFFRGELLWQNQ
jgi:hypothetical protein